MKRLVKKRKKRLHGMMIQNKNSKKKEKMLNLNTFKY